MKLAHYFRRIGYGASVCADLDTLNALMEAHVRAVPFENLDIYAGRGADPSVEAAYDQIVTRRQGGWCYEMNSLFNWALTEIGFEVTRLAAGVRRYTLGDESLGNHLCLLVRLDRDYLVDVGFGGSQIAAIPLEVAETLHPPLRMALVNTEDGYWRLQEGGWGSAMSYDFRPLPADNALLKAQHDRQVSEPGSIFRKTMTAKIRQGRAYHTLRGRMLETNHPGRKDNREIASQEDMILVLREVFGLAEPDLNQLWPGICARHRQMFPHAED